MYRSPHPHPRRQSRFPSGGKQYIKNKFLLDFNDLLPPQPHYLPASVKVPFRGGGGEKKKKVFLIFFLRFKKKKIKRR